MINSIYDTNEWNERRREPDDRSNIPAYLSAAVHIEHYPRYNKEHNQFTPNLAHYSKDVICSRLTKDDTVECLYLFGETILVTEHKFGCCPWKLL